LRRKAVCTARVRLKAWGAGHERTENMEPMFVTLEVSNMLSGWSN
jgi:hypothetical protein